MTEKLISPQVIDPNQTAILANPLWLLSHLEREKSGEPTVPLKELVEQEPIRALPDPGGEIVPSGPAVPPGLCPCTGGPGDRCLSP